MKETTVSKRPREEAQEEEVVDSSEEDLKRHKPYHHILSLLESEEEEPTQDLSSLITTLQQEITNSDSGTHQQAQENGQHNPTTTTTLEDHSESALQSKGDSHMLKVDVEEEESQERVMRHLLEASDDELGIPNSTGDNNGILGLGFGDDDEFHGDPFCDGLWELEDETANYYALLQSQLFM